MTVDEAVDEAVEDTVEEAVYSHWPQIYFLGRLLLGELSDISDVMEKA